MIIQFCSIKGGCGKSTLSVNLAVEYLRLGYSVALIDGDKQSSSNNWSQRRESNEELAQVHSIQKYGRINKTILDVAEQYDCVIVDTGGFDSQEMRTALMVADIAIMPFKPSQMDLDTLPRLEEILLAAKDFNSSLKVFGLLNMSPTNIMSKEIDEAKELLKDYPIISLMNSLIHERKAFRDCIKYGLSVIEMTDNKAKIEIENLSKELNEYLKISEA